MNNPYLIRKSNKYSALAKASAIYFVVLFLTFMSFRPALNGGFVNFDDGPHLLRNPQVKSLAVENIKDIFSTTVNNIYCPLAILSFAVEYHFFKLNPFIYHLDNLLLHGAVICLVMWFCMQLGLNYAAAALAALLFGIHPMHVESVAWVTERKDVLYAFFYMFSLCCYMKYLVNGRTPAYLLAVLSGVLSMLAKPMALSLSLIFFLCDWYTARKFGPRAIADKVFIFLCAVPIAWQTYRLHQYPVLIGLREKILYTLWALTFYVRKFFFPYPIDLFYKIPPASPLGPSWWGTAVVLGVWIFLIYRFRRNKIFLFANAFYVLSVFFLLRATHTHEFSFGSAPLYGVANRFMYLPSLGYCALVGYFLGRVLENFRKRGVVFFALIASATALLFAWLSFESFLQCHYWKDGMRLWSAAIAQNPDNATAYNNRGVLQKTPVLALNDYNRCIDIDPNFPEAYFNRANLYLKKGLPDLAIRDYSKHLTFDPDHAEAFRARSWAYFDRGDFQRALEDARKAKSLGLAIDGEYFSMLLKRAGK